MKTVFTAGVLLGLLALLALGVPIILSLGLTSFVGVAVLTRSLDTALSILATTTYEALRDYVFAVIPLFVLMGEFVARSGAASDLYRSMNRVLRLVPGRLAVATVLGNAVFSAVVGTSIAAAAAFSRIAYPAMSRHRYDRVVSLGCIAGSASLGMLIPPSVLMIVWGVVAELSIGKLFIAGVLPGLLLAALYALVCVGWALASPRSFGAGGDRRADDSPPITGKELVGSIGCVALIFLVLGGIWFGWFTPTEAAGVGTLLALALAAIKGLRWSGILAAIAEAGRISAPILFLLIFAQMYARLLAMGGIGATIQEFVLGLGLPPAAVIALMVLIWCVLGMFIDSISIILLTVPIFGPIAAALGMDPIAFAILGILAIEAGIMTPPFGLIVFTVKACVDDPDVSLGTIFLGTVPYWLLLIALAAVVYVWPGLATWLPSMY
jgi:C4-dicarboxylate transporter, DctM subunit